MDCPRCKIGVTTKLYENINIDNCPRCWGIWLDKGELQPILTARDIHFSPISIEQTIKEAHASIPKAEIESLLPCPKCSQPMHSLNYNYSSGVIINTCPNGHGVWFDKDELAHVQIFMEHWDEDKKKNQDKWMSLQKQAREREAHKLNQEAESDRAKTGPIGRAIDAVLDVFSEMTRKG